jgi:hypothetical protein
MARKKASGFGRAERAAVAAGGRAVEHWLSRALPLAAAPAGFIALAVGIVFMHRAWGGSSTRTPLYAVLVAAAGAGVAVYTAYAAGGRKHLRAMATGTAAIAALAATVGLVIGLQKMLSLYVLGAVAGSIMWGVRHTMKWADEGDGHPLGKLGEHIDAEKHRIFNIRRTGKGTVTADVAAKPGATIEEFQAHLPVLAAAAKTPPGAVTMRPDLDDSSRGHMEIVVADLLKQGIPWPGPARLGALVTDPFTVGQYANGDEVTAQILTKDGDVEHLLIVGVTGAGKSEFCRVVVCTMLTRRRVNVIGIDCSKGLQTFGPIAHGLTSNGMLITSQRQARAFMKVMPQVIKARTNYLASEGMDKWAPVTPAGKPTKINLLKVWAEEASDLADAESYYQMLRTGRSGGVEFDTSLQRASFDEMATKARAMHGGSMAFGCFNGDDVAFALPGEVIDAGAMPLWRNHKPGYAYLAGLNTPPENWPRLMRGYAADKILLAASVTAASAFRSPMDEITAAALGPLWAKRTIYADPVGVDPEAVAVAVAHMAGAGQIPGRPGPRQVSARQAPPAVLAPPASYTGQHEVTGRVVVPGPWPQHGPTASGQGAVPAARPPYRPVTSGLAPIPHHQEQDLDDGQDLDGNYEEIELSDADRAEIEAAAEEILGPLNNARITEIRAAGGGPDEVDGPDDPDAPISDTSDVEMDLAEDDVPQGDPRAMFERQLADWLDAGKQEFGVRDLYGAPDRLLDRLGRDRRWFYRNLPIYIDAGLIAEGDDIGSYVIARDPRGEPAAL